MEEDVAKWELWKRGNLRYLMRPHQQRKIYDFITNSTNLLNVINAHRRIGKSFEGAALSLQRCQSLPNQIVKYGAPTFNQAKTIIRKQVNKILKDCPHSMIPEYKDGNKWVFPNGSELTIVGLNVQDGDRLRGDAMDMCILDEVREVPQLDYIVKNVIGFQFVGRKNPKLILMTTPPKSRDHDFTQIYVPEAIKKGSYYVATVEDNKDWTEEDERLLVEELGVEKGSPAWLREAMCRLDIADTTHLVVPEFNDKYVYEYKRPEVFLPTISMDLAYKDYSAALFCYLDFEKDKIIIEDEVVLRNVNTKDLTEALIKKEKDLWEKTGKLRYIDRLGDTTLQQRYDMLDIYRYSVREIAKYDKDEAIASMRTSMAKGKIVINPKCKNLIYQLQNGLWNEKRTDFVRSERAGHLDATMALVYLNRNIQKKNPFVSQEDSVFNQLQNNDFIGSNND